MFELISPFQIGAEHIDQYGHANYKAVAGMLEPYQDRLIASRGLSFESIERDYGLRSFVKKLEIVWSGELKEGDVCAVSTSLSLGTTSMAFNQLVLKGGKTVVSLAMVVAMVNENAE